MNTNAASQRVRGKSPCWMNTLWDRKLSTGLSPLTRSYRTTLSLRERDRRWAGGRGYSAIAQLASKRQEEFPATREPQVVREAPPSSPSGRGKA
jgi:hypothetical protein